MKLVLKHIVIVLLSSITLTYFTQTAGAEEGEDDLNFNGSDCISVRSIRDYTPLDSKTLLLRGDGNRPYLVRLATRTFDMRTGFGISVYSRDDRLCPYGGDGLIFDSLDRHPVSIRSISRLSKEQEDQILVRYGKKDATEPQTPAPKEVSGAEVEELD